MVVTAARLRWMLDYLVAASLATVALFLRKLLPIEPVVGLYTLPLAAVIMSAWYGGRGPGWLAALVSAVGIAYWFIPPVHSLSLEQDSVLGFTIFVAVAILVTEFSMALRRAEHARRESESRLRQIAETTPGVLWMMTLDPQHVLYVNPSYERVWGRKVADLSRSPSIWASGIHPDDEARVTKAFSQWVAGAGGRCFDVEYRIVRPDGATRWIHDRGVLIESEKTALYRAAGVADDITERREAAEALRQSEAYLAETQKLSHTGSWAWAPGRGETRYLSEECYRILGFEPDSQAPRLDLFFGTIHAEDRTATKERLDRAVASREDFELDYRIVRPGGEARDIFLVGHPVFDDSGEFVEFVGTVLDVTERKRAENEREKLRQAQADLEHINRVTTMGELTASLAHEIRQPIAAAITNATTCLRWLERGFPDIMEARAAASRMAVDAKRAADIISRVRLLFRKGTSNRCAVDLNAVVTEMASLLRSEAQRHAVAIRSELAPDLPAVAADRVQLQQVLMNLMVNAIDAMKNTSGARELTLKTENNSTGCLVTVADTGPGLAADQNDRVFEAFFTTKADGLGMGLPISRTIIESHGGRLWASGQAGPGAKFHFLLPTGDGASQPLDEASAVVG
ncbi:MAG TPA: PAS domain-containing protein [Anaeromyxobacteraceae bacterium]|nr:PAS domain-containing protein [Anaeromyxobacteraceae bacterium]